MPALRTALTMGLILAGPALADHEPGHEHDSTSCTHAEHADHDDHGDAAAASAAWSDLEVAPGEAIVEVNGLVCSFCAFGAEKALSKLPGLDRSRFKDGVLIDIDAHRMTLALKPGAELPLGLMYDVVRAAGYEPVFAYLRLRGSAQRAGGRLLFRDSRSGQSFALVGKRAAGLALDTPLDLQGRLDTRVLPKLPKGEPAELEILKIHARDEN